MRLTILTAAVLLLAGLGLGLAQEAPATPAIWINVPFYPQTADGCGSASIAMVMGYWEKKEGRHAASKINPLKIQKELFSPSAKGIYASRMRQYFIHSGYRAFAFSGRWSDLEHNVALGRPLIVAIKASGPYGPLHYVVVVGIDSARGFVFVNDPARQKMLRISREGFESEWRATHDWTLLAVPQFDRSGH